MKKGLLLIHALLISTAGYALQTKEGSGRPAIGRTHPVGPEIPRTKPIGPETKYWHVTMIGKTEGDNALMNLKTQSVQLKNITQSALNTIKAANTIQKLNNAAHTLSTQLMNLRVDENAQKYLNGLANNLKDLASNNAQNVILASKTLHEHLQELNQKDLQSLHPAIQNLEQAYHALINKKAALHIQQAGKGKVGQQALNKWLELQNLGQQHQS